jgi:hypothetical protein
MDKVFFNFPISLLKPAFMDMSKVCDNIMDYAIFKHAETLEGDVLKRMKDSASYFKINLLGNITQSYENGQALFNNTPDKTAMTGIGKELLWDYYKNEKTYSEIAVLLAFLAIKSILGRRSYCKLNSEFLLCRMTGFTSKDEMKELPEGLKKYQYRYHMDCLKFELKKSFGLQIYARYTRGFFVSFELPLEQLIREAETKRKKYIIKTQGDEQSNAVKKVLAELYSNNTITTPKASE